MLFRALYIARYVCCKMCVLSLQNVCLLFALLHTLHASLPHLSHHFCLFHFILSFVSYSIILFYVILLDLLHNITCISSSSSHLCIFHVILVLCYFVRSSSQHNMHLFFLYRLISVSFFILFWVHVILLDLVSKFVQF